MRITNSMMINDMMSNITKNQLRMNKYQNQMSTGKKISVPSDDPVVAARALKLRTDVAEIAQYKKNVKDANSWLDITETALGNINDVLKRANELAVKTSNSSLSADDMKASASEVKQLREQLIELANSSYAGRYIFSGYNTDQKLIDSNGNFNINQSSTEDINYEIGVGNTINVNVLGCELFHSGASTVTKVPSTVPDMIKVMDNFINDLNTDNHTAISALITDIQTQEKNVTMIRSDVGARTNRLDLTASRLETDNYNFTALMADNEDVDMAETIMNLKNEENVYQASLAAGARVIQPSLVDFLK